MNHNQQQTLVGRELIRLGRILLETTQDRDGLEAMNAAIEDARYLIEQMIYPAPFIPDDA